MFKNLCVALLAAVLAVPSVATAVEIAPETNAMRVPPAQKAGQSVQILVVDNRPDVLSGDSAETYEGMTRELYGIPISRNTADRTTMATYLGERLRIGFERAGYVATYSASNKGSKLDARASEFESGKSDFLFAVDLREWSYDMGFVRPQFTYDITVELRDSTGKLITKEDFAAVEPMPKGGFKHFKRRYAELYQTIFDRIFAAKNISEGLAGRLVSTPASPTLTVEARLETLRGLRAQGLINEDAYKAQQERILSEL